MRNGTTGLIFFILMTGILQGLAGQDRFAPTPVVPLAAENGDTLYAAFLSSDTSWCSRHTVQHMIELIVAGSANATFDLVMDVKGKRDTLFFPFPGTTSILVGNTFGDNVYRLLKIIENEAGTSREQVLNDSLVLRVNEMPDLELQAETKGNCSPVMASFTASSGFSAYTWSFGDGGAPIPGAASISHSYSFNYEDVAIPPGDTTYSRHDTAYRVKLAVESRDGCPDSISGEVHVRPAPVVDFFVNDTLLEYPDSTILMANLTSTGEWSYLWDFGDESYFVGRDAKKHVYSSRGIFDLMLRASSDWCADSLVRRIHAYPPPPVASFTADSSGCLPFEAEFTSASLYADTYLWTFGDGDSSRLENPVHTYTSNGEHVVQLLAEGPSGRDSVRQTIYVHEPPSADFRAAPISSTNLRELISFTNQSSGASRYLWDFGDGSTDTIPDPTHIYGQAGQFDISLIATSIFSCSDTLTRPGYINLRVGEGSVEFPTAFRWNGSGPTGGYWNENSEDIHVFHPEVVNVSEYQLLIYSRWGELIFESRDLYIGWDGYLKSGALAPEGVYVYKVIVKYVDGVDEENIGDITFLH